MCTYEYFPIHVMISHSAFDPNLWWSSEKILWSLKLRWAARFSLLRSVLGHPTRVGVCRKLQQKFLSDSLWPHNHTQPGFTPQVSEGQKILPRFVVVVTQIWRIPLILSLELILKTVNPPKGKTRSPAGCLQRSPGVSGCSPSRGLCWWRHSGDKCMFGFQSPVCLNVHILVRFCGDFPLTESDVRIWNPWDTESFTLLMNIDLLSAYTFMFQLSK